MVHTTHYTSQVSHHQLKLLQHPLIDRYIQYKWWKVAFRLFLAYRLLYVLFLALLTSFALTSPRPGPDDDNCEFSDIRWTLGEYWHTNTNVPIAICGVSTN